MLTYIKEVTYQVILKGRRTQLLPSLPQLNKLSHAQRKHVLQNT